MNKGRFTRSLLIVASMLAVAVSLPAAAGPLEKSAPYMEPLNKIVGKSWPAAPSLSYFAAKVEQETCITPTHAKCWSPRAELKTSREYGFGFGQITTAYRADGSVRFDKFSELKAQHALLREWEWADRFDPVMQLTAMVEMDRTTHRRQAGTCETAYDCMAFSASAYNGGESGVMQDRRLCSNTAGCNPSRWVDNVALHSTKSRVKWQGYGQSAYDINRTYVQNVLYVRKAKYVTVLGT